MDLYHTIILKHEKLCKGIKQWILATCILIGISMEGSIDI